MLILGLLHFPKGKCGCLNSRKMNSDVVKASNLKKIVKMLKDKNGKDFGKNPESSEITPIDVANKHLTEDPKPTKDALSWFEVSSADRDWKPAKAKIISKNKVEVFNAKIDKPVYVRYAWASNPEGVNLYNKEGLPTAVFTTLDY